MMQSPENKTMVAPDRNRGKSPGRRWHRWSKFLPGTGWGTSRRLVEGQGQVWMLQPKAR